MKKLLVHPYSEPESETDEVPSVEERTRFMALLSDTIDGMPDSPQKWSAALALGSTTCAGLSMEQMAANAGCTPDRLLKDAQHFCLRHKLLASPYLKRAVLDRMAEQMLGRLKRR